MGVKDKWADILLLTAITILFLDILSFVKPLFMKSTIYDIVRFYSQDFDVLNKYNPLYEYGIHLEDLPNETCSYVVSSIGLEFYDKLGPNVKSRVDLHVCSQVIYNLYLSAVKEAGVKPTKEIARRCILNYITNHKEFLLKMDNSPLIVCLLDTSK